MRKVAIWVYLVIRIQSLVQHLVLVEHLIRIEKQILQVFGAALGASIGSGKKWTMEDSIKLGAAINASNAWKKR